MKRLLLVFLINPLLIIAQSGEKETVGKGIQFEHNLSWEQVRLKAKQENKYIFMDCYTTWCTPCKKMAETVFIDENVGELANEKFISIKVQMDSTGKDDINTKNWYTNARNIAKQASIKSYPCLLFFDVNGNLIHKAVGYYPAETFKAIILAALDPKKQYFSLLEKYKHGEKDTTLLRQIIDGAQKADDNNAVAEIADAYISQLSEKDLSKKEVIIFIKPFVTSSTSKAFPIFFKYSDKINSTVGTRDFSETIVQNIIYREEAFPHIDASIKSGFKDPDWAKMRKSIERKYNRFYADYGTTYAKMNYYGYKKDWPQYTSNLVKLVMKYGESLHPFFLNNHAWTIFQKSSNENELNAALKWMKERVPLDNGISIDTYANLLYRLGKRTEAIEWEGKAVKLDPNEKDFQETLNKMKNNLPTWPAE